MTAEEREQHLSEVFDAMEAGEATENDYWDALFPTAEWCEHELKKLGFHSDYDTLYEVVKADNVALDAPVISERALEYRTITPEMDGLEHDERATVITALRYWYRHQMTTTILSVVRGEWMSIPQIESKIALKLGIDPETLGDTVAFYTGILIGEGKLKHKAVFPEDDEKYFYMCRKP